MIMNRYILFSLLSILLCGLFTHSNQSDPIHSLEKEVVDPSFIVPDDGGINEAFKAAQEREDTAARFIIFIRKGEYYLKGDSGATIQVEGIDYPSPITTLRSPNVTIIGEKWDSVILWNKPEHEGIDITATLLIAPESRNTQIKNLSTGMKQKASLAISIAHDPEIIIYDEPTNGLDILSSRDVENFLMELKHEG